MIKSPSCSPFISKTNNKRTEDAESRFVKNMCPLCENYKKQSDCGYIIVTISLKSDNYMSKPQQCHCEGYKRSV